MISTVKQLKSLLFIFCIGQNVHAQNNVSINGVMEIEYVSGENFQKETSNDLSVAKVELKAVSEIKTDLFARLTLEFKENQSFVDVDEIVLSKLFGALTITTGRLILPFGRFESHMISDPVTKDLGENHDTALVFTYDFF